MTNIKFNLKIINIRNAIDKVEMIEYFNSIAIKKGG
jgi:hypothetical protein